MKSKILKTSVLAVLTIAAVMASVAQAGAPVLITQEYKMHGYSERLDSTGKSWLLADKDPRTADQVAQECKADYSKFSWNSANNWTKSRCSPGPLKETKGYKDGHVGAANY